MLVFDAIVEHLPLGIRFSHVLSHITDWVVVHSIRSLVIAAASHLLVHLSIGVLHEFPHNTLLLTEVARSTEHVAAVVHAALVHGSINRADAGGASALGLWAILERCRQVIVIDIARLVVS